MNKKNRLGPPRQTQLTIEAKREFFAGPLPPPQVLEQYNAIVPGLAERIVALTERQSAHRQELEAVVVRTGAELAGRGQWMAYSLGIIGLLGGFALLAIGKDAAGITAIITAVAGLAGVFIYGKRTQRKELTAKKSAAFPPAE